MSLHKSVLEEKDYNFVIRLFIDLSIKNDTKLFEKLYKLERVEIIVYYCKNYLQSSDSNFHVGTFGMFVRFFPLFDFPNNDANIVMIADMDDNYIFRKNMEVIKKIDKNDMNKIYIFNISVIAKNIKHNFDFLYKERITGYFISPKLIGYKRIDNSVIISYIKNIDKYYENAINVYEYKLTSPIGKSKWLNSKSKFIYGIDEYFLNSKLMYYLIDNNLPYGFYINFDIIMLIYYFLTNYSFKKDKIKLIEYIIDYILDKLKYKYNKQDSITNKYKYIDKIIYSDSDQKLKEEVYYIFYKTFLYNYRNSKYNFIFSKNLYKLIKMYDLFGIYKCEFIIYYNDDSTFIIEFINKNMFDKNKIKELKKFSKKYAKIFL
jgi:hypothetical protein